MSLFLLLKTTHMTCALLSISGFLLRGYWMVTESPLLQARLTKVLPHLVDSLLLVSAIWMTMIIQQFPFVNPWLTAKLAALLLYILSGTVALKRGKTKRIRTLALFGAVAVFFYIVAVAFTHDPLVKLADILPFHSSTVRSQVVVLDMPR